MAIIGMPFDTAASFRVGARFAPQAIRQASMLLFPYHPTGNVYPFEDTRTIDIGDVSVIPHNIHRSYEVIESAVLELMERGIVPIGLGGDHSITLASLHEAAKTYGPVALIHFDIDFVDPSFAPGTGTLEVGGFTSFVTLQMIRSLTDFHFIGFDLVAVLPPYDPTQITAFLAATLVHDFASLVALQLKTKEICNHA